MQHKHKVAGLVLAGGQGTRMHHADKAFINIGNRPCIDWVITRLMEECTDIAISANGDASRFKAWNFPVIADTVQGVGPLAGLLRGLEWAEAKGFDLLVSVPVDTPFIPVNLVSKLQPGASYATYNGQNHPLVALWPVTPARALLAAQLSNITNQNRKQSTRVCTLANALGADAVDFSTLSSNDPFLNINTPQDLITVNTYWSRNKNNGE
ncbi:MAG: molybdenum cofactor guanylyltransferase [Acetobacter syzygii]|uniref:molybdenum cofactor guanylyltransferase n=1 Tax=Acetobacter syzygii TaxID=146476 RepID=UPI0039EC9BE5